MGFWKEFKKFALQGNVLDLAVGVIIGGAFGKIVTSFVNDILLPPIGLFVGNVNFKDLKVDLTTLKDATLSAANEGTAAAEPIYWNYGAFIQQVVDFAILAFCVFLVVKLANKLASLRNVEEEPEEEPEPTKEEELLTEIRDLLKEKK